MSPIPFEAVAYEHAAWLIGRRPWDVSRDGRLLLEAHRTAIDRYGQRSCIVGIDLYNVEAEAYGCKVEEPSGEGIPAITRAICSSPDEIRVLGIDPERDGRIAMILDTAERLKRERPGCDVRIPICGPFSLAGHLMGLENLLCCLLSDHEGACRALGHVAGNLVDYALAAAVRGLGVTIFESAATPPLVSPALFASAVAPALRLLIDRTASRTGDRPHFIMGGNVLGVVDQVVALGASYLICPVETDQLEFMRKVLTRTDIFVRVNMAPRVFVQADPARAVAEAERARAIAALRPRTSVGTALPLDALPEVVLRVAEFFGAAGGE